ncbi:PREDICTED: growth/differentiation factor 6-B-like [Vollenhovia emeryi]|uniref:growth/differentiation factor 6-B-like n=1 Tax=Vollenhovia emeryi TaxID=411798 RepID=UPI0005F4FB41|nr:PREDICTED: growth/differentiation factor 6-B-like [Vollenhovia emeryi]
MQASGYWLLLLAGTVFVCCCLWQSGLISRWSSNMHAEPLIHLNLSIPSSSSSSSLMSRRPPFNRISTRTNSTELLSHDAAYRRKYRGVLSRYMLQLYHRRSDADAVRAIQPAHTSGPLSDGGRILEFAIPSADIDEMLETAELLGIAGAIVRVRVLNDSSARNGSEEMQRTRKDDAWRAFDITSAVVGRQGGTVKLYVHGRSTYHPYGDRPILLLNYRKVNRARRRRRSVEEQEEQEEQERAWGDELPRRRRRNNCHRRPMYVDFALIAYDRWVIAPTGYQAYQCSGRCSFPLGDHLSPTKHAIVQTLMHSAFQSSEDLRGNKFVGRACCVPTKLEPISLLYLNSDGSLKYEYTYEDMVVSECGCR